MAMKKVVSAALAGVMSVGLVAASTSAFAADKAKPEKCAGIVKKGMNDCGTASHACAGQSTESGSPTEWIFLPKGVCGKIVDGKVIKEG